jgi:hypothetical protein
MPLLGIIDHLYDISPHPGRTLAEDANELVVICRPHGDDGILWQSSLLFDDGCIASPRSPQAKPSIIFVYVKYGADLSRQNTRRRVRMFDKQRRRRQIRDAGK